ncbi:MAG TPA: hypothetical protein VFV78_02330 [Vicinamibacterales bacterium]|nr:hypothetical protein [Vicinamibacterales bacterium]
MPNDAVVTVRIPSALKRRIEQRARRGHRSLSAQVLHDLEQSSQAAPHAESPRAGRFLGLFAGMPLPSDADIHEVRTALWGRLGELAGGRRRS